MTVTFDPSVLLSYYQVKDGLTSSTTSGTTSATAAPAAPWTATSTTSSANSNASQAAAKAIGQATSLSQALLIDGTKLIDPTSTKLSTSTSDAKANADYQNLFALYQGLTSLQTLAAGAATDGVAASTLAQFQQAFASGLTQVQSFLTSGAFKAFQVGDGTVTQADETSTGVPQENDTYTTGLTASSATSVLPQLQGDVQFTLTVQKPRGPAQVVNFNLADLGSTPRTLSNVVTYLNGQLATAGVQTRFSDQLVSSGTTASTTASSSASSATTSTTLPVIALTIQGSALETLSFSAAGATPSVYVAQTSTEPVLVSNLATTTSTNSATASTTSASTAPVTASQVLALDLTGQNAVGVGDKLWSDNLPSGASVQATATGDDGSVYVLANVTAPVNGQSLQGTQDAALLKYDSAGNLVYTRTLGAASSASGYALAVSPDGSQVAVAGTVTGTLDPTDSADAASTTSQSFVTAYDAASGNELWSQTQHADVDNQASGVAFGSDNAIYVAGSVQGSLKPGAVFSIPEQGYLQAYAATSVTDDSTGEVSWNAVATSTTQFGTSGINRATGVAVGGGSVYVSGVENGDAVVRAYDVSTSATPTLAARQDLGAVEGGGLNGIAVGADGSVYVAGDTHNAALAAGTVTSAYSGDGDAFVAKLSPDLDPTSGSLAYVNLGGATTATALAVSGGQVYLAGQTATGASATGAAISELGYAAEINPTTGQVVSDQTFKGVEGNAAPTSIAVSASGASSLDALGLPTGAIAYSGSTSLIANTSLRAGDEFAVQVGAGAATTITIDADEAYVSLAKKIEQASGYRVTATTLTDGQGDQQLEIKPSNASTQAQVAIEAGRPGRDALTALGLKAGLVTNASPFAASSSVSASTSSLKAAYTINVPTTLSLASASDIAAAQAQLSTAVAEVKSIYSDLSQPKSATATASSGGAGSSALIKYYDNQAANYSTALSRLTGSA